MNIKPQAQDSVNPQRQDDISFFQRQINGNLARQDKCLELWHVHLKYGFCGKPPEGLDETCRGFYEMTDLTKSPESDFGNLEVRRIFHLFGFSKYKPALLSLEEIVFVKNPRRDPEPFQQVG